MENLPAPLVSVECDLRDFKYMPLDVVRLRDSDLASVEAEAFRAAVLSWCVAWHQTPAASLPDDDAALCRLLGYGRDTKGWQKVRAAGALHGYVKCSDGRLYHPVVAEKATEAWHKKLAQRDRTEAARLAKLAQKAGMSVAEYVTSRAQPLSQSQLQSQSQDTPAVSQKESTLSQKHDPPVTGSKGEERRGEEERKQLGLTQSPRDLNGHDHDRSPPTAANGLNGWEDGREVVGGHFWDMVWPMIVDAARIDLARWTGNEIPARKWLRERIHPDLVVGTIRRCAERADYVVPNSLAYFDKPIREAVGKAPR